MAVRLLADGAPPSAPGGLAAGSTAPLEALYGGRQFTSSTISGIVYEIKTAGNGARGIVQGQKGRRAHVFNVVNVKGRSCSWTVSRDMPISRHGGTSLF
ncbi:MULTISPECIES: hypothetical protein [Streptomyces]|uniref:hypothetical protein n=1 Tax=Streptomyces TaxID=1883 RepID=UPI00211D88C4|nr:MULTISPECIES: hypothetical protein [unclassified Streptomyces]WTE31004.1 hypothetical protein OHB50_37695 [Streptomyces anulatus]